MFGKKLVWFTFKYGHFLNIKRKNIIYKYDKNYKKNLELVCGFYHIILAFLLNEHLWYKRNENEIK